MEVLAKDGRKLSGVLKEADEQHFVVTIQKKVKEEEMCIRDRYIAVGKRQETAGYRSECQFHALPQLWLVLFMAVRQGRRACKPIQYDS